MPPQRPILAAVAATAAAGRSAAPAPADGCDHPVYCTGALLDAVQMLPLFNDSKTFVDMPIRTGVADVLAAFDALGPAPTRDALQKLVDEHFLPAGHEVREENPSDWGPAPSFLAHISDPQYRRFAESVHGKWRDLVRRFDFSGLCDECSSAIHLDTAFVVPGGRFREFYYWDTFWSLEGLYASEMFSTARDVILGLLSMVDSIGFVPNGARIYYRNRSQPPFLVQMVRRYVEETGDSAFLTAHLPTLLREVEWWEAHRRAPAPLTGLSRYVVATEHPRPESYKEDVDTAAHLPAAERPALWSEIAAAAETGWDFSSRWLGPGGGLESMRTSSVVPADLNAILLRDEEDVARWLGDSADGRRVARRAARRRAAMQRWLWDGATQQWRDYDTGAGRPSGAFYPSNFAPLWGGALAGDAAAGVVAALAPHVLAGGLPTSAAATGEQWDFPNAWPPLQHLAAAGLRRVNRSDADALALTLARGWVASNYCGWLLTQPDGTMFEKYDATAPGIPGGGGEYDVQAGFGWTNGVVLWMLREYGAELAAPADCAAAAAAARARLAKNGGAAAGAAAFDARRAAALRRIAASAAT